MTFREKLADLISGGALTQIKGHSDVVIEKLCQRDRDWIKLEHALLEVRDTTATGKSGTAQRVHRIAKEALE